MGHVEALKRKMQLGLIRPLAPVDMRRARALQWISAWGFSTSTLLIKLCLAKNDLVEMRAQGLLESKLIDVSVTANRRAQQMRILYLSVKGRRQIRRGDPNSYLPPREPASVLRHHNYLAQAVAVTFFDEKFSDLFGRWMPPESWTAAQIQHADIVELAGFVPDFYVSSNITGNAQKYFFEFEF